MEQAILRKKRRSSGKWMVGITLAILAVFGFFATCATESTDSMISHAEKLVSWQRFPFATSRMTHDVMILDHHWTPDGSLLKAPFSISPQWTVSARLEKLSAKTGQTISNRPIALNSIQKSTLEEPRLSPDGKWLILEDSGDFDLVNVETGAVRRLKRGMYGASDYMVIAHSKDGNLMTMGSSKPGAKRSYSRMTVNYMMLANRIAWMPDSRRFIEISDDLAKKETNLVVRTLTDKPEVAVPLRRFASGFSPKVLGVTAKGDVLVVDQSIYSVDNGYLRVDLKNRTVTSHKFKNVPQGLLVKQIEMSPDGKRLLWKTVNIFPDPAGILRQMTGQLVFHKDPKCRVDIKVSDLDGENMHEVCGEMLSGKQEDDFQMAHWMPDSMKISFWYKDAIYAVSAK